MSQWLVPALVFWGSFVVALLFQTILPESMQVNESSDYVAFYEPVARNIVAGRGLVLPDRSPAMACPPGFPFLLAGLIKLSALLNLSENLVLASFLFSCMAFSAVFLFGIANSFWGVRPALIVAALWMTYPFALWFTKQPNSEVPFLMALYGSLALLVRNLLHGSRMWYSYMVAGLFIGLSSLIRPIAVGAVLACGILSWFALRALAGRVRLFLVGCLIFGNIIAIMPWELWMFANTVQVNLLSSSGISSTRDARSFAMQPHGDRQESAVPDDVRVVMRDIPLQAHAGERAPKSEQESFLGVASVVTQELRTHPLAALELSFLKDARRWFGTYTGRYETPNLLVQFVYLALIAWGGRHTWKQGGLGKRLIVSAQYVTLHLRRVAAIALSIHRYRVPTVGLSVVLVPGTFGTLGAVVEGSRGG